MRLIVALTLILAGQLFACDCAPLSATTGLKNSEAVFLGNVIAIGSEKTGQSATLEIVRSWKGPKTSKMEVKSITSNCGITLRKGESYLVFAAKDLEINQCATFPEASEQAQKLIQDLVQLEETQLNLASR